MAKKEVAVLDANMATIIKKYGNVIKSGTDVFERNKTRKNIPVSMSFDNGLNGGIAEGTWTVISGAPKSGKAQDLDSFVYTPYGPIKMGDIKVGQEVLTPTGTSVVTHIHPQGKKQLYKVQFDDNSYTLCCEDHVWEVHKNNRDNDRWELLTTKEIISKGLMYTDRPKWKIKLTEPVEFTETDIDIDPYILGALIGDGGLTGDSVIITSTDEDIVEKFRTYCSLNNMNLKEKGRYGYILCKNSGEYKNDIRSKLKKYNLLGSGSHDKFIPKEYKYNSIRNRIELIRGLMDTDGHNSGSGHAEYTTVSLNLAKDFIEVVQSLGFKCTIRERYTSYNKIDFFKSYRVFVKGNDINSLFSLKRKQNSGVRKKPKLYRTIKNITIEEIKDCQCITISDDAGLYLTDNFIVTHNSSVCLQIIANAQKQGKKGFYIDAESRLSNYNLEGIEGLDISAIQVISPEEGDNLSADAVFSIIELLVKDPNNRGCVIVLDSISTLLPQNEMDADVSASIRASLPKMIAHWGKKIQQKVRSNNIALILITHYITNTSGYGKKNVADSGTFIQYQASNRIDFLKTEDWEEGDKKVGIKISAEIDCSANGSSGKIITSYVRFGKGIDSIKETIELGESFGLIDKAGAWYTIPCVERVSTNKFQGVANLYAFLDSNRDIVDEVRTQLEAMLKL